MINISSEHEFKQNGTFVDLGGMDYGGIGTSEQPDTKDGFEDLCPVCGDKEHIRIQNV